MSVNLSRLTKPEVAGLLLTPTECAAAAVAWMQSQGYTITANASDPAYRVLLALAERESNMRQQIYDNLLNVNLAYASGAALNNIGLTYYQIERQDGETDDAYRLRLSNAPELYAVGLSGAWYKERCRLRDDTLDAYVLTPQAGYIFIYPAPSRSHYARSDDPINLNEYTILDSYITEIEEYLREGNNLQQSDKLYALKPELYVFTIELGITIFAEPDGELIADTIKQRLRESIAALEYPGGEVSKDLVRGLAFVEGVKSVDSITFWHKPTLANWTDAGNEVGGFINNQNIYSPIETTIDIPVVPLLTSDADPETPREDVVVNVTVDGA